MNGSGGEGGVEDEGRRWHECMMLWRDGKGVEDRAKNRSCPFSKFRYYSQGSTLLVRALWRDAPAAKRAVCLACSGVEKKTLRLPAYLDLALAFSSPAVNARSPPVVTIFVSSSQSRYR